MLSTKSSIEDVYICLNEIKQVFKKQFKFEYTTLTRLEFEKDIFKIRMHCCDRESMPEYRDLNIGIYITRDRCVFNLLCKIDGLPTTEYDEQFKNELSNILTNTHIGSDGRSCYRGSEPQSLTEENKKRSIWQSIIDRFINHIDRHRRHVLR